MNPASMYEADKERVVEELMAHIILAGGSYIEISRLKEMRLGEILDLIWPNGIRLQVGTVRK